MAGVDTANKHRSKNHVCHPSKEYWNFLNFILEMKRKIPTENPVGGPLHEQVILDRPKSTCKWCPKFGEKKRKET
ncbi:hypothetical protein KUTeg_015025, partial [Tegillarca granosa]